MKATNHVFRLAARPVGTPKRSDWNYAEEAVGQPADGEFLVEVLFLSLDPAMRGWMNAGRSYVPPIEIGEVMRAYAVGRVVESRHPGFAAGDHVAGTFGVQEYALSNGKGVSKVDPGLAPLPVYVSVLSPTGLTAYFGLLDVGKASEGDTVLVSGAAGAVGSLVGQIAKIKGCRTVGIAGGPEKCRIAVEEFGYDAAIDYKSEDVKESLRRHCPKGIDVYFDNVGGEILDAALAMLRRSARVVLCGAISQYNNKEVRGPANYLSLLVNRASLTGFIVFDYQERYGEGLRDLAGWLAAGRLRSREQIVTGLETFPEQFLKLFQGENTGKLILQVRAS